MTVLSSSRVSWALMVLSFLVSFAVLLVGVQNGFGSPAAKVGKGIAVAPAALLAGAAIYFPAKSDPKVLKSRVAFRVFGLVTFGLVTVIYFL